MAKAASDSLVFRRAFSLVRRSRRRFPKLKNGDVCTLRSGRGASGWAVRACECVCVCVRCCQPLGNKRGSQGASMILCPTVLSGRGSQLAARPVLLDVLVPKPMREGTKSGMAFDGKCWENQQLSVVLLAIKLEYSETFLVRKWEE